MAPSQLKLLGASSLLLSIGSAFPIPFPFKHLSLRQSFSIPFGQPSISLGGPANVVQNLPVPAAITPTTTPPITLPEPTVAAAPVPSVPIENPPPVAAPDVAAPDLGTPSVDTSVLPENILPPAPDVAAPATPDILSPPPDVGAPAPADLNQVLPDVIEPATEPLSVAAEPAPEVPVNVSVPANLPTFNPADHPPYQLYSLLSTPTTITFLLNDPNTAAPMPESGVFSPVRCSATFANEDGLMDMSQIPYDPQVCVDVVSGVPSTTSLWVWQVMDYAGPGLFVIRVWRGWLDRTRGPCAVQPDGTPTFCNTNYYGEHQIDSSMGDVTCDPDALSCETPGIIEIPITSVVA